VSRDGLQHPLTLETETEISSMNIYTPYTYHISWTGTLCDYSFHVVCNDNSFPLSFVLFSRV